MEGEGAMALTRALNDLMRQRADRDPAFRDALLREGIDITPAGAVDPGKATTK